MFNLRAVIKYRNHGENATWWRNLPLEHCDVVIRSMVNMRKQWPALSETEFEFTLVPVS